MPDDTPVKPQDVPPLVMSETRYFHCASPMTIYGSEVEEVDGAVYRKRYFRCEICSATFSSSDPFPE